jgi:hypothetical protein
VAYVGFDKLKSQIAARGGAADAGAGAASIGRKKYGKRRFQNAAARKRRLRGAKRDRRSQLIAQFQAKHAGR